MIGHHIPRDDCSGRCCTAQVLFDANITPLPCDEKPPIVGHPVDAVEWQTHQGALVTPREFGQVWDDELRIIMIDG